jgi:hypothetical protein
VVVHRSAGVCGTIPVVTHAPHLSATIHIRLLAGHATDGHPVFEVLPALSRDSGLVELVGSPGLVLGCAAGDILRVGDDGQFEVVQQGTTVCVQAARRGCFAPESFAQLEAAVAALGGLAEAPPDLRFIVVTLDCSIGLPAIEDVMNTWAASTDGGQWWFGTEGRIATTAG